MIEGTPGSPYCDSLDCYVNVQINMKERRELAQKYLKNDEKIFSISTFPLMGATKNFTFPQSKVHGEIAKSCYVSDDLINPHPRFG
jgi:glutamate--cysteine ligase catalytic subunit